MHIYISNDAGNFIFLFEKYVFSLSIIPIRSRRVINIATGSALRNKYLKWRECRYRKEHLVSIQ